ncbi:MAG: hypothetical protein JNL98_08550 [Bryobacterales bacterium]|nr:hypothetical protein [Bryobacterales bacterium]
MGHHVVRIRASTWDLLRDLQRIHDLDVFGRTAKQLPDGTFEIEGYLSDDEIARLVNAGYGLAVKGDGPASAE